MLQAASKVEALALANYGNRFVRTTLIAGAEARTKVRAGLSSYSGYNAESGSQIVGNNLRRGVGNSFITTAQAQNAGGGVISLT